MYKPKYFKIRELIPPDMDRTILRKGATWAFDTLFDERLLRTMDNLREKFGRMVVNTWKNNGRHCFRGFRPPECTIGARFSQHRFGRAIDMVPLDSTVEHIREEILAYPNSQRFKHIGGMEMGTSWLHIDVRGRRHSDMILTFTP
jgi:hypothetical protein